MPIEIGQIVIGGGVIAAAGKVIERIVSKRRTATPAVLDVGTRVQQGVALLESAVAQIKVAVAEIPAIQQAVAVLEVRLGAVESGQVRHGIEISCARREFSNEIADIRREAAVIDDRMRAVERKHHAGQ